jgi:2-methylaconitate cis-trans-isomerase PrpF
MPGIPTIFVDADAIGYTGTELQDRHRTAMRRRWRRSRAIRAHGAIRMGLVETLEEAAKRRTHPRSRSSPRRRTMRLPAASR